MPALDKHLVQQVLSHKKKAVHQRMAFMPKHVQHHLKRIEHASQRSLVRRTVPEIMFKADNVWRNPKGIDIQNAMMQMQNCIIPQDMLRHFEWHGGRGGIVGGAVAKRLAPSDCRIEVEALELPSIRREPDEQLRDITSKLQYIRRMEDNKQSIYRNLVEAGYTVLGSGNYSIVVLCPWDNTKVLKLGYGSCASGNIWEDGWLAWAAFCMMHNGKFKSLPIIHNIEFRNDCFVALLDKYDATWNNRHDLDQVNWRVGDDLRSQYGSIMYGSGVYKDKSAGDYNYSLYEEVKRWKSMKFCPSFSDLHHSNIMIDLKRKRVVVTDPCSDDYDIKTDRKVIFQKLGLIP